jgi:hypothetical protein
LVSRSLVVVESTPWTTFTRVSRPLSAEASGLTSVPRTTA